MITRSQAKDLGLIGLARFTRFAFGRYWTPAQRADLDEAVRLGRLAYAQHARKRRTSRSDRGLTGGT